MRLTELEPQEDTTPQQAPVGTARLSGMRFSEISGGKKPEQSVSIEGTGRVVGIPGEMPDDEANYSISRQAKNEDESGFLGFAKIGLDVLKGVGKGIIAPLVKDIPQAIGETVKSQMMEVGSDYTDITAMPFTIKNATQFIPKAIAREYLAKPVNAAISQFEKDNDTWSRSLGLDRGESVYERTAFDIASGVTYMGTSLALAYATKNPTVPALFFGELAQGRNYKQYTDAGMEHENALAFSTVNGAVEGGLEFLELNVFTRWLKGLAPVRRTILRGASEGIQEFAQEFSEETIQKLAGVNDSEWSDIFMNASYAGAIGLAVGLPVSGIVTHAENKGWVGTLREAGMTDKDIEHFVTKLGEKITPDIKFEAQKTLLDEESKTASPGRIGPDGELMQESDGKTKKQDTQDHSDDYLQMTNDLLSDREFNKETAAIGKEAIDRTTKEAQAVGKDKVISERSAEMSNQQENLLKEIDALEARQKKSKNTKETAKMEKQITALMDKYDLLESEQAETLTGDTPVKGKSILRVQASERLRSFVESAKAGFKHGFQAGKATERAVGDRKLVKAMLKSRKQATVAKNDIREGVKAAQQSAIELIEASNLRPADKAKFMKRIVSIQSVEQFLGAVEELEARAVVLSESSAKRILSSKLKKELKTSAVKKKSGVPAGKFNADVQETLDLARKSMSVTSENAGLLINKNLEVMQKALQEGSDAETLWKLKTQNRFLSVFMDLKNASNTDISALLEVVQDLKSEGRTDMLVKQELRRGEAQAARAKAIAIISGGKGVPERSTLSAPKKRTISQKTRAMYESLSGNWYQLMDFISSKDKTSKSTESFLSKTFDAHEFNEIEKTMTREANLAIRQAAERSYSTTGKLDLIRRLKDNTDEVNLGTFKRADGKTEAMVITKDQAIKKWMELQDPGLQETFFSKDGMAWTPEIVTALDKFLTQQDKNFAMEQLQIYRDLYAVINPVFAEIYGTNLPFNSFYSPISRSGFATDTEKTIAQYMQESLFRMGVRPKGLISRVQNELPLRMSGSVDIMQRHISEMAHFVAWADQVRFMRSVFMDNNVKAALEEYYPGISPILNDAIDDIATKGIKKSVFMGAFGRGLDKIRVNLTRAKTAIRPVIALKQLTGLMGFWTKTPTIEFLNDIPMTGPQFKNAAKVLSESPFLKNRWESLDRDIAEAINSEQFHAFRKHPTFFNALMLNVAIGDRAGIIMGGWPYYQHLLRNGMSQEDALMEFGRFASRSNGSSDISELSQFQRGGSLAKLFTMWTNQPAQYARMMEIAARGMVTGRMPKKQAIKTMLILNLWLPMVFSVISNAFRPDARKMFQEILMAPFNGFFFLGDIVEPTMRVISGDSSFSNAELPIMGAGKDFMDIMKFMGALFEDPEDAVDEKLWPAAKGVGNVAGDFFYGLPVKELMQITENAMNQIVAENYIGAVAAMAGYGKSALPEAA